MRPCSRRSLLSMIGVTLPFGLGAGASAMAGAGTPSFTLSFRPFEDSVREAFSARSPGDDSACRRVEVGESDLVRAGVQGCHNDRPFAGFPAGHLRIVRTGSAPGPLHLGVRLYVSTVEIVATKGPCPEHSTRPLDFSTLPPAPILS